MFSVKWLYKYIPFGVSPSIKIIAIYFVSGIRYYYIFKSALNVLKYSSYIFQ